MSVPSLRPPHSGSHSTAYFSRPEMPLRRALAGLDHVPHSLELCQGFHVPRGPGRSPKETGPQNDVQSPLCDSQINLSLTFK